MHETRELFSLVMGTPVPSLEEGNDEQRGAYGSPPSHDWRCPSCGHVFAHPAHTDPDGCENCGNRWLEALTAA